MSKQESEEFIPQYSMGWQLRQHELNHEGIVKSCPFCSLRRIAEALELIAVSVKDKIDEGDYYDVKGQQ